MRAKNLKQRVKIKFYVKIEKGGSETLALLILVLSWVRNEELRSFLKAPALREKGEKISSQFKTTRDSSLWIHCTRTNGESTVLFGRADEVTGICSKKKTRNMAWQGGSSWQCPMHDVLRVRDFLAKKYITKVDNPPYSPDLAPCEFWPFPEFKKLSEGAKIFWHSWHRTERDNVIARYSVKLFSRLFPTVSQSSHEVHSFTKRVFRRQ
jgi:hypothetical protein